MSSIVHPFNEYLKTGITAIKATELLEKNDGLSFPQLESGLFPAANFDNLRNDETGMSNAWLRDTSCIGLMLLEFKQRTKVVKAANGVLSSLQSVKVDFERIIAAGEAPLDDTDRPPIRYAGRKSEPVYEWASAQNDALGYALQFIGRVAQEGMLQIDAPKQALIDVVVSYLEAIQYWQDLDSGHWEEIKKLNASSIGTVVAGLRAVRAYTSDPAKLDVLIDNGLAALEALLPSESKTVGFERSADLALLFLVEPQKVLSGTIADQIVAVAERELMGEYGFRRYVGDSYWGPDYREHFRIGSRTADFSNHEDMSLRDSYLTKESEAQWTLADPMVAAYYSRKYQKSDDPEDARKAKHFMARALKGVVVHKKPNGSEVWRLPELYFIEKGEWVPNDHLGLLWAQANLIYGLLIYQRVFGDTQDISE